MKQPNHHITVFEHDKLRYDFGEKRITEDQFNSLKNYYGTNGVPYFDLCYNGVKFKEYVGVIQIGTTTIEVLPKADKNHDDETWKKILIGMIRAVGSFEIKATSDSNLTLRPNTILDLYFELFIQEIEYLIHSGLLKQYRKIDNNSFALKGNLQFSKHIQQNLTHQERFYVRTGDNARSIFHPDGREFYYQGLGELRVRSFSSTAPAGTLTSATSETPLWSSAFWMMWIRSTCEPSG